ncbi:TPA: NAD(+)--arginine ADP-ribosyltransferase [Enterococcus faecalis]|nr:NAD(+)--arginine ADP-ribosyltransferase [Enterococcus faecalis]
MTQLNKWQKELQALQKANYQKTDNQLFNVYRQSLIDIKKRLKVYTENAESLSFSTRLEVERLFSVADEINAILQLNSPKIEKTIKDYSAKQAEQGYYGLWYTLEQSQNIALSMPLINHDYIMNLVNAPVAGKRLSKRLYKYRDELAQNVTNNIITGLFEGKSYAEIARWINEETEASYKQALRIARTEAGRTQSVTTQKGYEEAKELGINIKKKWLATIDKHTRRTHQELDGKEVDVDEEFTIRGHSAKGPRMFGIASEDVNCRCTTIEVVDDISPELRKDNESKEMSEFKSYDEWYADRIRQNESKPKPNFTELDFFGQSDLQDDSDKWVAGLKPEQVNAMKDYTSDAFAKMNKILRNEKYNPREKPYLVNIIQNLDDAISKFKLKHDIITYRGVSANEYDAILNGNVFKEFKSTSINKKVAEDFLNFTSANKDGSVVKFLIPKGTQGAYIGTNSSMKKESEFLLNRNLKYTVEIVDNILEVTILG